ncbi:uncharacterized protein BYT42DRAFT_515239 [Radiomyces spectabilis]|uniref:uncharacterized protein n=1 Tax=Radiomyces spectabilis TaxID=64574 RepID=UPI00221F8A75|nr:uncharacterized protein BYT42DRAFT_515239 [Radiomyces spectabilis]KAI8379721.1 hypothetical protein BYT42DRAFT_515239 [Radiomyces spectabilis]
MPLPTGNYLEAIRTTSKEVVAKSPVKVSEEGIKNFLENLDKQQYEELSIDTPMRMPVKFDNIAEEVNFIALIDLLNFGSGYRVPLHELAGRGAFDTIRFGAMSFHIGGTPMTAETFKNITAFEVSEIFQFPIDREVQAPNMPGVTIGEPTPLKPLAQGIADVLNTTGEFLEKHGYKDLASFILDVTKGGDSTAAKLVENLIKALPGLHDFYNIDGTEVYLFKKAQILVYHLWLFFKDQDPARFDFKDIHEMTIFSDNVIPTMLAHLGVLELPQSWKDDITANVDLGETRATILRAAAIVACEDIIRAAPTVGPIPNMHEGDLDVYLWRLGKIGDYRKVPRFELRDTVMF